MLIYASIYNFNIKSRRFFTDKWKVDSAHLGRRSKLPEWDTALKNQSSGDVFHKSIVSNLAKSLFFRLFRIITSVYDVTFGKIGT